MAKIKVHTIPAARSRVQVDIDTKTERVDHGTRGWTQRSFSKRTTAMLTGDIEVYIDLTRLEQYIGTAFRNKQRRFVRGPVEVRAVNLKEVEGTREVKTDPGYKE